MLRFDKVAGGLDVYSSNGVYIGTATKYGFEANDSLILADELKEIVAKLEELNKE